MGTAVTERATVHASLDFAAMGTECQVQVWAPISAHELAALPRSRVELLDRAWSRFRADSELSHVNRVAGSGPIWVSDDFAHLVRAMREGWEISGGLFDPTITPSLNAWGYNATFSEVLGRSDQFPSRPNVAAAPGMGDVLINGNELTMPGGVELDSGSVGKGLAADIVSAEIIEAGAIGVLVNLGGDVAVRGIPGDHSDWVIEIVDERATESSAGKFTFPGLPDTHAGIATSTTMKRSWAHGLHHIINPRTGEVATTTAAQVSVLSNSGTRAEIIATAALLSNDPEAVITSFGAEGVVLPYPTYQVDSTQTASEGATR